MNRQHIREVHREIRARIEHALGDRSWSWLAERSGVPSSTLSAQVGRPRFSVDVLVSVARALEVEISDLIPGSERNPPDHSILDQVLQDLETLVRTTRVNRRASATPRPESRNRSP